MSDSNLGSDRPSAYGGAVYAKSLGDQRPDTINRVYEVEEHMGGDFIDELARMNRDHLKLQEHAQNQWLRRRQADHTLERRPEPQKSLPAYVYGVKLGQMARKLE